MLIWDSRDGHWAGWAGWPFPRTGLQVLRAGWAGLVAQFARPMTVWAGISWFKGRVWQAMGLMGWFGLDTWTRLEALLK